MPTPELDEPGHHEISRCAYFHWLEEGSPDGQEKRNWFAAEAELMQLWLAAQGIAWARETANLPHGPTRSKFRI